MRKLSPDDPNGLLLLCLVPISLTHSRKMFRHQFAVCSEVGFSFRDQNAPRKFSSNCGNRTAGLRQKPSSSGLVKNVFASELRLLPATMDSPFHLVEDGWGGGGGGGRKNEFFEYFFSW